VELLAEPLDLGGGARLEPRAQGVAVLGEFVALGDGALARPLAVAELLPRRGDALLELDDARPEIVDAIECALALARRLGGLFLGAPRGALGLADDGALALRGRFGARLRLFVGVVELRDDRLHELGGRRAVLLARGAEECPREIACGIAR